MRAQGDAGGTDDECRRVGVFGEPGADHGGRLAYRHDGRRYLEVEADHRTTVDDCSVPGNRAVEHVGDEQLGLMRTVQGGHVPGTVDQRAIEGLDGSAETVEDDQATGAGDGPLG